MNLAKSILIWPDTEPPFPTKVNQGQLCTVSGKSTSAICKYERLVTFGTPYRTRRGTSVKGQEFWAVHEWVLNAFSKNFPV